MDTRRDSEGGRLGAEYIRKVYLFIYLHYYTYGDLV